MIGAANGVPRNVLNVTGGAGQAEIVVAPGTVVRDWRLGNVVVIDVMDRDAAADKPTTQQTVAAQPPPATSEPAAAADNRQPERNQRLLPNHRQPNRNQQPRPNRASQIATNGRRPTVVSQNATNSRRPTATSRNATDNRCPTVTSQLTTQRHITGTATFRRPTTAHRTADNRKPDAAPSRRRWRRQPQPELAPVARCHRCLHRRHRLSHRQRQTPNGAGGHVAVPQASPRPTDSSCRPARSSVSRHSVAATRR